MPRKIINGKMYNTETATEVAYNGFSYPSDFHYFEETLYQKKTGEFFIYGEGGPLSHYRVAVDTGGWTGGEDFRPISIEEAKTFVEKHASVDTYIELFGEVEE